MKNNDQTTTIENPKRNKLFAQFKEQALAHAQQDGAPKVAKDLVRYSPGDAL